MLDLNLGFVSHDVVPDSHHKLLSTTPIESSESFNSSSNLTLAGDDDDNSATLNFLALNDDVSADHYDGRRTIQLFPLAQSVRSSSSSSSASKKQWLGLSSGSRLELEPIYYAPAKQWIAPPQQVKKSRRGPRSRSSQYRGVTFYRRTGRWESHIWDCGKQVYLGGFDTAQSAARAYDRAAIKFRGTEADINFSVSDYEDDIKQMSNFTKEEFVHILRRQSTGFSRGRSKFRGVTLHKCGRWEARMGQFMGRKAYDQAAIECNGREAVTNFDSSSYDGVLMSEANNKGSHQNLDLNLGIAPPFVSEIQKENINLSSFPFQLGCDGIPIHTRARNENSVPAPMRSQLSHGSMVASDVHPIMSNMNSIFFPIHMERAMEKSMDVNSFPSWAWQLQDLNGGPTSMPLLSTAASSGFPSSTATSSSSAVTQLHFPNKAILRHHFSPSFTNNIPHFAEAENQMEPNPSRTPLPLCSDGSPSMLPCDEVKPLTRYQPGPTGEPLPEPHMASFGSYIESDHDSAPSPTDMSAEKSTTDSKALVAVPDLSMDALAVVPGNRKSRRFDIGQRRIRRPFSVTEVEALVQAVEKLGTGRWRDVKLRAFDNAKHRTYVDLKDKWKTLVHTARISPQQRRGEPVPQELLDRVLTAHAYWSQQQAKQQLKQPETCLLV